MASLIITIISIALVAITVLVGANYMGDLLGGNVDKVRANMLIEQSRQVWASAEQYMIDNGKNSFNDFGIDAPVVANYTNGRVPILIFSDITGSISFTFNTALDPANMYQWACGPSPDFKTYRLDNNNILGIRYLMRSAGRDVVHNELYPLIEASTKCINMGSGYGQDLAPANMATHPLVKLCLKINAQARLPSGLSYAPSGLPYDDGSGPFNQINYCFISASGFWGSGYPILMYNFAN